jgi:hypothetical protein
MRAILGMSDRIYISAKLSQWLDPSTHKVAISLPEIVQQTNQFSVKNRPGCNPALLDSNPQDLFLHYNVKCNLPDSDPAGHDVRVHFDVDKVEETNQAKDLDVRCSCTCPAFLYWGAQWNLHQRDGLEGEPRPLLVAPTERLDLRSHFVICKHCKAVMERILPAVQHNIVNILREKEVAEKKKQQEEAPEKLQKEQERLKRKNLIDKIRGIKNKKLQEKMLEQLKKQEEEHLEHIVELNEEEEKVKTKGPGTHHEVEREAPATLAPAPEKKEPAKPAWMGLPGVYQTPEEKQMAEDLLVEETKAGKPTDRELLEQKKKQQQNPNKMKEFLNRRKRTSLEAAAMAGGF